MLMSRMDNSKHFSLDKTTLVLCIMTWHVLWGVLNFHSFPNLELQLNHDNIVSATKIFH